MKDTELRGIVLKQFYDRRKEGLLGIRASGPPPFDLGTLDVVDVLRACDQLADGGLIEWRGAKGRMGATIAGAGKINAHGVDVAEGESESPIPIRIDQSTHVQNINISGQHGGVQVAGAHSQQHQNIAQELEKLVGAINESSASEGEKKEAKSRLAAFLESAAVSAVLGPVAARLLEICK